MSERKKTRTPLLKEGRVESPCPVGLLSRHTETFSCRSMWVNILIHSPHTILVYHTDDNDESLFWIPCSDIGNIVTLELWYTGKRSLIFSFLAPPPKKDPSNARLQDGRPLTVWRTVTVCHGPSPHTSSHQYDLYTYIHLYHGSTYVFMWIYMYVIILTVPWNRGGTKTIRSHIESFWIMSEEKPALLNMIIYNTDT